jgi:hypothetical protein
MAPRNPIEVYVATFVLLGAAEYSNAHDVSLFHQINIVAQTDANGHISYADPRGGLTELGPKIGMSAAEIHQARTTTGLVVCTGSIQSQSIDGVSSADRARR